MAAMPMFDSIRSLRSMSHTNSNAQYAKTVCARSIKQPQQSLKQKAFTAQTNRNADVTCGYADKLDGVGTLTGLEQPNCSARTVKRLVRAVAIVIGISLFLPMASAVPATIDPKQSAKAFARSQISDKREYVCLSRLYGKESAWNYKARNGSHYGIPQGRSEWLKTANPQQQVTWGLNYIHHRYKTPCEAWRHWLKHDWH